ncbi:DUF7931 domain-containing protein [Pseudoduganella namucuonensis]|uniref:DUF7931 domain-containing protein n=1 Tax=Pseudoduganella namucuonensis TaxID=1035707 RepID=A0A1I7ISV4_9BURK|nr:hypothetical protein [Pseudoduganella namucuonensis]SFU76015.1 hypothetical protein SAMN05216552_100915 [Pseudoduganella namucuonensis]
MEPDTTEKQTRPFDTRAAFQEQLRDCFSRARHTLQVFDPDFATWELGSSRVDALLRAFLARHGRLELVAHSNAELERNAPRFLRLLKDYTHLIECRLTPPNLRLLTDSFCVADRRHLVRRFHADHMRGVAVYGSEAETQDNCERFAAIWAETIPGLHAGTTGL